MKRLYAAAAVLSVALLAVGCSNSSDGEPNLGPTNPLSGNLNPVGGNPAPVPAATAALFQPLQGVLPWPTDLYFSSTTDGTLNIPANSLIPNIAALNAIDGFSTTAPLRARFASPIDPTSLTAANVRVYQVSIDNTNKATLASAIPSSRFVRCDPWLLAPVLLTMVIW
jgi:hypothetical protein